jgi:hypothetical protein
MNCLYCDEPVINGESVQRINNGGDNLHLECFIRMIVGSIGHQLCQCSCYGGSEEDPPGASRREGARIAAILYRVMYQ